MAIGPPNTTCHVLHFYFKTQFCSIESLFDAEGKNIGIVRCHEDVPQRCYWFVEMNPGGFSSDLAERKGSAHCLAYSYRYALKSEVRFISIGWAGDISISITREARRSANYAETPRSLPVLSYRFGRNRP